MAAVNGQLPGERSENTLIKKTFKLLRKGERKMKLKNQFKNIVLVLGDTGNGKTVFTRWIVGGNTELIAEETIENYGEYIINIPGMNNSTLNSVTVYPTLVVDPETNVPYYDCPGFNDTRSTSNDIATTYFIKKLVNFADSVKIVFIINYPSVRKGVERRNFMKLLEHATNSIRNVEKFRHSIALVVTKVDNLYKRGGTVLVNDNQVISLIAAFLEEVKLELSILLANVQDLSFIERRFYDAAIKLVSYLLTKDGEQYAKIGIFRRPDESGLLSEFPLLQEEKNNIRRIIYQNLTSTEAVDDDFGYTISDTSKNKIYRFVNVINEKVGLCVDHIAEEIIQHYSTLTTQIRRNIREFGNTDSLPNADNLVANELSSHLRKIEHSTSNLINVLVSVTSPYELVQKINVFVTDLEVDVSRSNILNMETQGKYFNFLQAVSEENLNIRSWDQPFRRVLTSISEQWGNLQEDIDRVASNIHGCILTCFDLLAEDLKNQMDEKIKVLEIQEVRKKLDNYRHHILWLVEKSENGMKIKEFLRIIRDIMHCIMINVPNDIALNIIKLENCLKYLQTFNEMISASSSSSWVLSFQNVVTYLKKSKTWYKFLDALYHTFSEYELQKNKNIYNVADIENWRQSNTTKGITITNSNFQQFLQKISEHNIEKLEEIRNFTSNEIRLEEINQILNLTLKQEMSMHRSERTIFITDEYIRITDFMKDSTNPYAFSSILKSGLIKHIKIICIFASRTIFIDDDLNFPGLSLGIIAPKWEIIGERKINLDGADGEPRQKANNGNGAGEDGEDGKPGLPGKPGGTFFGIGSTFVNGSSLTITVNGGNGGPGQDGGDGQKGKKGLDAQLPTSDDSPTKDEIAKGLTNIRGFKCKKFGGKGWVTSTTFDANYEISGLSGERGGNGGNGGKGGEGGNPGVINLYELDKKSGISKHSEPGSCGIDGRGGKRGEGGQRGDVIIANCCMKCPCCIEVFFGSQSTIEWTRIKTMYFPGKSGDDGSDGSSGANREGLKPTEPANIISEPYKVVNEYKKYLIKHLNCRFKRRSLVRFFNRLNENNTIKSIYNTIGLIEEFQMIDEVYSRSCLKQSHFIPIYQSMLSRISEYRKRMETSETDMALLKYLYTVILSKISVLSNKPRAYLIIDLVRYLGMIKRDIVNLNTSQMSCQNSSLISRRQEDYACNVSKRVKEVQCFIMEQILPNINIIRMQIDNDITSLIEEFSKFQHHAEREEYLNMKQHELEDSWALNQVFYNFKLITQVVSFLCMAAVSAKPAIETATLVIDSLNFNRKETPSEDQNITYFQQVVENGIRSVTDERLNCLNKFLGDLSNETKKYPESLQDLFSAIEGIKNRMDNVGRRSLRLMEIKALESDLKLELKRKEEILKSEQGDQMLTDTLQVINRLNKIAELGSLVVNIRRDDGDVAAELYKLASAFKRADKKFLSLKQYEENIYTSIDKMVTNIEDNVFDTGTQMESTTGVYLDVTKWQVQITLKNIQVQMKGIFERIKVQDNIAHYFDALQEAMTTLINVYDHIEYYREQQTLVNHISDICFIGVNSIDVNDQKLVKALHHLDITLKSNLILKNYKMALDAFNQWVFPFSQNYIENSMLPYYFRFERNIESLVSDCVAHVEHMENNVGVYRASVMRNDKYLQHGEFNNQNLSSEPFFLWKNENNKKLISELFSGKKILLKAEVKKSPLHKDVIKFSFIEFRFRCKNESLQFQLDQILNGFDIMAIHMGNSYYRYGNKIYLISSDKQTIVYSFEKNASGESVRSNDVYEKIRRGDLMLSPYTVWQLQLIDSTNSISFDDLKRFEGGIDLELTGYGSYVMNHDLVNLTEEDYIVVEEHKEFE